MHSGQAILQQRLTTTKLSGQKEQREKCRGWVPLKIVIRRKKFSIFDSHGWCGK
jgi:hypothetical protein